MNTIEPVANAITQFLAHTSQNSSKNTQYNQPVKYLVALSGGIDSVCLLDALNKQVPSSQIKAIYIDHQLQACSAQWAKQNKSLCKALGIDFSFVQVEVDQTKASLEQSARDARYKALKQQLTKNTYLLTGHHQDDQAETFLLQLFRGAGSKGLASMPYCNDFASGKMARPLLQVTRADIEMYAKKNRLSFIQDPTNQDIDIRRNFVRHQLLPSISTKWQSVKKVLAKAAKIQADNQGLLEELAKIDFKKVAAQGKSECLSVVELKKLSANRQSNLLRYWLAIHSVQMPSQIFLQQIKQQLLEAREDSQPLLELASGSIRRYQDQIYLVDDKDLLLPEKKEWQWQVDSDLQINSELGISSKEFLGLNPSLEGKQLVVTLRKDGVRFVPQNKSHSVSLKKYLQEKKVLPWQRAKTLLVWSKDHVVAIVLPKN